MGAEASRERGMEGSARERRNRSRLSGLSVTFGGRRWVDGLWASFQALNVEC